MEMVRRTVLKSIAVLLAAAFLASCDPFGLRDVLKAASRAALSLDPTDVTVPAGATVTFTAEGGVPPYAWSVSSGPGSIDADTGEYLAPLSMGSAVVRVTDAAGVTAETGVTIEDLVTGLNVTPSALTVTVNGDVQFAAIGGTGSYTWDFASQSSGSPGINATTGYYVAGSFPGTDVVRVSDGVSAPATATVTVVALSSAVDYSVTSTGGLPSSGEAGTAIGGGVTFTLANTGTGDGAATVSWRVYLSDDGTLGGGDVVASEGISGALAAGASVEVGLGGSWPTGPVGPGYLIVTVSAADDTSPGNNTAAGSAFTLDPRQVDYDVTAINHDAGTIAGNSVDGSFTVENVGSAAGAATLYWYAYASADTVVDGSDYLLQSGTHAAMAAGVPTPFSISSTWPTSPGSWRLLVLVSAADDVAAGNDTAWTTPVVVTGAPPANIDYAVDPPAVPVETTAGVGFTGSFTVANVGTVSGAQTLYWTVYRSPDSTLDIPGDPVVAAGSRLPLPGGSGPTVVNYPGTWPAGVASWYLFATVSAGDDWDPSDNESSGTMVATTPPDVDYAPAAPAVPGGTIAGDQFSSTFLLTNTGTDTGSQTVAWTVYRSSDPSLEIGTDPVAATGSLAGLAPATPTPVPFTGLWPAGAVTWHLFAVASAPDDNDGSNDDSAGTAVVLSEPNANYDVTSVDPAGGTVAGGPFTGTFDATNLGPHAGTQVVPWRLYVSTNAVYDVGVDVLVDSGVTGKLGVGSSAIDVPFGGTWPATAGTWYLIVVLDAPDDQVPANDWAPSAGVPVTAPIVDYDVTSVATTGGAPIAGRALTAEFVVQNVGAVLGSRAITWIAYRSDDATLVVGTDPVVDSGSVAALPDFLPLTVPFGNTWPVAIVAKTYYLFVRVSAADDVASGNDTGATGMVTVNPPTIDYVVTTVTVNATPRRPDQPVNGTFIYRNDGLHGGTPSQTLSWEVYASMNPVIDVNDTLIASGSGLAALTTTGTPSSPVAWAGTWPLTFGDYFILARVTCAEDVNTANNVGQSVLQTDVGVYEAEAQEPNNDYTLLTNPSQLNVTLRPGMSLKIKNGAMGNADRDDIFQFNTGTASRVVVTVQWSINDQNVRIWFMDGPNTFIDGVSGLSGSMSLDWVVDAPGVNRWIDLDNYWTGADYSPPPNPLSLTYTCWITAQ